jgi:pyruvate/2-oxoacid:ferredoxin oxidoreductase alpha subunit
MVKIPFIISTPISLGMEMYNYLNEKKKKINSIHINNTRPFDKEAIILIEKLLLLSQKN